jgi:amylosucrase
VFSRQQQILAAKSFVVQRLAAAAAAEAGGSDWPAFASRFDAVFPTLCELFADLYGEREDCLDHLAELVLLAARSWRERSPDLKTLDAAREADPGWFRSNRMLGGVCYVDRFAGNLKGIRAQIPYF